MARRRIPRIPLLWLIGLTALAGASVYLAVSHRRGPRMLEVDHWDMAKMLACLDDAGLGLRVVSTQQNGDIGRSVFLTATDRTWAQLDPLFKSREEIHQWTGTIYLERGRTGRDWSDLTELWGDCCLTVGPFIFFGDRELLARIRIALTEPGAAKS